MTESPMSASPYQVLGVPTDASEDDLKKAFRKRLRETHPDLGGSHAEFVSVQLAWERIGTPENRASYDRGRPAQGSAQQTWAAPSARARPDTRPKARSYGHPGGWRRENYLQHIREWVGRGAALEDPYDPALVRSAPRQIRHILADALAEEATARLLADLGIGYTIWHDVATSPYPQDAEHKLDHVVLGPTGLFAILSEDYGEPVRSKRGELIGAGLAGERPMHALATRAKAVARACRVRFSALVIVLPDEALDETILPLGSVRGAAAVAVRRSFLPGLLRGGLPGAAPIGGNELFDVRTRLQGGIRFVE